MTPAGGPHADRLTKVARTKIIRTKVARTKIARTKVPLGPNDRAYLHHFFDAAGVFHRFLTNKVEISQ
jgi:hypothetical protein